MRPEDLRLRIRVTHFKRLNSLLSLVEEISTYTAAEVLEEFKGNEVAYRNHLHYLEEVRHSIRETLIAHQLALEDHDE
jgi:hypothetical protein